MILFIIVIINSLGILPFNKGSAHLQFYVNADIDSLDTHSNNRGGERKYSDILVINPIHPGSNVYHASFIILCSRCINKIVEYVVFT